MALCEYDLDLSGGLMEEIEKLVAPPQSEESTKRKKREHAYYKKPGKPHNHDLCDSCGEGGDLLCCDKCPASFHMECHDPPLDDEEIPMGEWVCHRCKSRPKPVDDDAASTCSSKSRHSETSASRKSSRKPSPIPTAISDFDIVQEVRRETLEPRHPLQILARAASLMNPKQFEVPKELNCSIQLQGASKKKWWVKEAPKNTVRKPPHELDNGMVPLPAKVCFTCSKSCRKAPLLQCDYCPLLFHLDCLNPPLTTMPQGRWMCPNHCEHVLDEKLLKSTKLTERVKLWDKFTGPVSQHQCKISFLNKIHRPSPPFRIKIKHKRKMMIKVPQAIKSQYELPPSLLPKIHSLPKHSSDCHAASSEDEQNMWLTGIVSLHSSILKHLTKSETNQSDSNTDCEESAMDTAPPPIPIAGTSTFGPSSSNTGKPTASVTPVVKQDINSNSKTSSSSDLLHSSTSKVNNTVNSLINDRHKTLLVNGPNSLISPEEAMETDNENSKGETINSDSVNSMNKNNRPVSQYNDLNGLATSSDKEHPDDEDMKVLSGNIITSSADSSTTEQKIDTSTSIVQNCKNRTEGSLGNYSKTELLMNTESSKVVSEQTINNNVKASKKTMTSTSQKDSIGSVNSLCKSSSKITDRRSSASQQDNNVCEMTELQMCIENKEDVDVTKLDPNLVQLLAMQQIKQMLSPSNSVETEKTPVKKSVVLDATPKGNNDVRARAVLCSLTGNCQTVPMTYRNLTIGTGADMDVCLSNFGDCGYVSAKHACIFYDEATRHFELLNYSDHGTTVDNVLYSCDFSEKPSPTGPTTKLVSNVRKIVKKSKNKKVKEEPEVVKMPTEDANKDYMSGTSYLKNTVCTCKTSSSSLIGGSGAGWEGTAVLHHGSYIKLGCLQFVFSIVEQATRHPIIIQRPDGCTPLTQSTLEGPVIKNEVD